MVFRSDMRSLLLFAIVCAHAENLADGERGGKLLETHRCTSCHSFSRETPPGPLAKLFRTPLTPSKLTGAMWSHAPKMWAAGEQRGIPLPNLTVEDSNDILVWFAAAGYYEPSGDARRGARLFQTQRCGNCHKSGTDGEGPPVTRWGQLTNPIELFLAMWRHAPSMKNAMDRRSMPWPSLSTTELRDILSYVRSTQAGIQPVVQLRFGDPDKGRPLLEQRSCVTCHRDRDRNGPRLALDQVPAAHSFTELAAILWNHAPMMMSLPPSLNREEIGHLVAYLWKTRYFEELGSVVKGKVVFENKRCQACHAGGFRTETHSAPSMLSALSKHSPAVLAQAQEKGAFWGRFVEEEMADLMAYLNTVRPKAEPGVRSQKPESDGSSARR